MILPRGLGSRVVPFKAGDGLDLNLVNVRGEDAPTKEPVLLVHGAGVRADIFRAPVETHDWLKDEFADVPLRFFKQMRRCVKRGNLVSFEDFDELPRDFAAEPPRTDARFVFLTGAKNLCFLPASQIRSHEWFVGHGRADHALHVFPEYSHLDVFMGKRSARDVFPIILEELAG